MPTRFLSLTGATVLAAVLIALSPAATAADLAPRAPAWVDASTTLTFSTFTEETLSSTLHIHKITLDGQIYTAQDLRDAYESARAAGTQSDLLSKNEATLTGAFADSLASEFPLANRTVDGAHFVVASLTASGSGDPYSPTVDVLESAHIEHPRASLGISGLSDAAVTAVFDAGAVLTRTLPLEADDGYTETITYTPPAGLAVTSIAPDGSLAGSGATFSIANLDGRTGTRDHTVTLAKPAAHPPAAEDVRPELDLALPDFEGESGIALTATLRTEIRAFDVGSRVSHGFPPAVSLSIVGADALRELLATHAITPAQLSTAESVLLASFRDNLSASLKGPVAAKGGFEAASLDPNANGGPVVFSANANGTYSGANLKDAKLAMELGATFPVNLTLTSPPHQATTYRLTLPNDAHVKSVTAPGTASANVATILVDNAGGAATKLLPVSLVVGGTGSATYTSEVAGLNVTVDITDLDISIPKAVKGDLGTLIADVNVRGELHVLALTPDLKKNLPPGVSLDYLSSDGVRELLVDGKITRAQLDAQQTTLLGEIQKRLADALSTPVTVTGGFEEASLASSLISHPLSDARPIVFTAHTHVEKALSPKPGPAQAQTALFLYQTKQTLDLPRVQGLDTLYRVILPRGIAVASATSSGSTITTGTTADGRAYFDAKPTSDSAPVTVAMAVTPTFVLLKFWYVFVVIALIVVLLVGIPILLAVRARRKRRATTPQTPPTGSPPVNAPQQK